MKIEKITNEHVLFDNGSKITFDHEENCCEYNYADFPQLEDTGVEQEEFKEPLIFESAGSGFRFGNKGKMYFVPCYSAQNGYYTTEVDIYYDGKCVCYTYGELEDEYSNKINKKRSHL